MKTGKIIGIILIVAALYLGYTGITKISNNSAEVKVLGVEIDASNESGKETGYLYLAGALFLFVGGIYTIKKE
jgi:hypothetical protein